MKYLAFIALIAIASASDFEFIGHPDLIEEVNSQQNGWVAGENQFTGMSFEDFRSTRLGLKPEDFLFNQILPDEEAEILSSYMELPDTFDSREQWPSCIHAIRDQAQCGSCWAFSASEVLSDRFCIESDSKTDVVFSPQEMISCSDFNMGCNGGRLGSAWQFMCHYGLVADSCQPYTSGGGDSGKCDWEKCTADGQTWKTYRSLEYKTFKTVDAIKQEIYTNGPIQTGFNVYSDFMSYKSGVYTHTTGTLEGGHAVKIVGWGSDNGTPYWIVANSWNTSWGLDGYFWFAMNQKDSNFEKQGTAGKANVNNDSTPLSCYIPI